MGIVYVFFRISYEIKRKLGWHKIIFPTNPEPKNYISLGTWKQNLRPFFSMERKLKG